MQIDLSWGAKVSHEFGDAVIALCKGFGWEYTFASYLMAVMAFEGAEQFNPKTRNEIGATGPLQILPSTAIGLGTTVEALAAMTPVEYLTWVKRYFQPYAARIHGLSDMYAAVLMPKYVSASDDTVIFQGPLGLAYRQNKGLDINHDGSVTKAEAASLVLAKLHRGNQPQYLAVYDWD
jgi:hypothetical protein